jgi:hypothetical protein
MKHFLGRSIIIFFFAFSPFCHPGVVAQGYIWGIMGGPTISNQRVNGYQREPFVRYHGFLFMESTSDINPNALYARLGYHIKGSAVNVRSFTDDMGGEHASRSYGMEFHNLSFSVGVKQRRELGNLFYSYGFGIRGDYNLKADYGIFFAGLDGGENKFTYGVNVDVGMEFPLSELISTTIELGFSPDLAPQIYIPQIDTGYNYGDGSPVILPETNLTNIVFEARVGFRFWRKIIYTD